MDILIGTLALIVGVASCLAGRQAFAALLPVLGFVPGFFIGAGLVAAASGDRLLATTPGFIAGLAGGAALALLSHRCWLLGVLVSVGSTGIVLGAALFVSLGGAETELQVIFASLMGLLFMVSALLWTMPDPLIVTATAMEGAALTLGGFYLLHGDLHATQLGTGVVWQRIADHWTHWLVWVLAAAVGIMAQALGTRRAVRAEKPPTATTYAGYGLDRAAGTAPRRSQRRSGTTGPHVTTS